MLAYIDRFTRRRDRSAAIERATKAIAALIGDGAYIKVEYLISDRRKVATWSVSASRFVTGASCECVGYIHTSHDPLAALAALHADVIACLTKEEAA